MCGIVGQIVYGSHARTMPDDILQQMIDSINYRGPDDEGIYRDEYAQLGFRRLAIVDLGQAGHQPMSNEDSTIWIVFNGEIYNYQDLRVELSSRGHTFHSCTDTETIIHAYEEWGPDCLQRFNGMFAFAIWDSRRRQAFCARDRFGVKPLYFTIDQEEQRLLFASEIKALLRHPRTPRRPDQQSIFDFLVSGLLDHTNRTCFAGIEQLLPAHYMLITPESVQTRRYWDLPDEEDDFDAQPPASQRRQWAEHFRWLLEDAVRLRLHADVPVGTCLSGGLDSSAIVMLANRLLFDEHAAPTWHDRASRQKTFSACYEDKRHDERQYIDMVLNETGAEANFTFPGAERDLRDLIPKVVWHQEEPFGSTSILAQWHVMQAAAGRGMKVMLDGQGADELLGGYLPYFSAALADNVRAGHWTQFARTLQLYRRYHKQPLGQIGLGMLDVLVPPDGLAQRSLRSLYRARQRATNVLQGEFAAHKEVTEDLPRRRTGMLKTLLYRQATQTSLPALLHYEDRNSMAFSIEARTPFLDYRIGEFLFGLPNASHMANGTTKVILRDAMRGVLPEPVRTRRDKKGFSTPEDVWFRSSLREWASDILKSPSLISRGFIEPRRALALFDQHARQQTNASAILWRIISVELWCKTFLDIDHTSAQG